MYDYVYIYIYKHIEMEKWIVTVQIAPGSCIRLMPQ